MFEHQETKRRSNLNPQLVRSLVLGYEKKTNTGGNLLLYL